MCNEKLNLVQLLSNCHRGTKLWCPLFGEVEFDMVEKDSSLPIVCTRTTQVGCARFTSTGRYYETFPEAECVLFPSKDNRDWSTFCVYEDGDILANDDGRAFIFRGKLNEHGYPMAYGGVDTCDMFIECEDNKVWASTPFRKATPLEVDRMVDKMKEAGYIWDTNRKELRKDLPVDTLVAVSDNFKPVAFLSSIAVRRYAGEHACFSNNGGSKCNNNSTVIWCHIVPLDKLVVNEEGLVQFNETNDYGTYNYHA